MEMKFLRRKRTQEEERRASSRKKNCTESFGPFVEVARITGHSQSAAVEGYGASPPGWTSLPDDDEV